jgi:hypothetical protein
MPIHTIKGISILTGIPAKNIHTYIHRGKLLEKPKGLIDDSNPMNMEFINKHKISETSIKNDETPVIKEDKHVESKKQKKEVKFESFDTYVSENELRTLKAEKLEEDIKLAKMRNEKIEGKLIPTDIVQRAILDVIQRYKMSFMQQAEQHLRDVLNELSAGNEIITLACTRNIEIANSSFNRAIFESKQAIKNSISESLSVNS